MSFAAKGRVLETAILVLVSRKGDPFWSHDRLVCAECPQPVSGRSIDVFVEDLNVRF